MGFPTTSRQGEMVVAFNQGDIVRVCLDPTLGNELKGRFRPVLVLSRKAFNNFGTTLIAPISQGGHYARMAGFTVSLMGTGIKTQGVVLVNQVRMMDLSIRQAKKIETVPKEILEEVSAILSAIHAT